jgi:hypothetical protein
MDPVTIGLAFTAAQAAVKGIKQAIALGKDIHSITNELSSFFKSSAEVKVAAVEAQRAADNPHCTEDVTMMALDIVLKEKQLRDDETALKDMIIYELDSAEVWFAMERKRDEILEKRHLADQEKIKAETERVLEEKRQARIKERKREIFWSNVELWGTIITGIMVVAGLFYGLWWMINYYRY